MKKHIAKFKANFKKQYKSELPKSGLVILGAVGGVLLAKAIRKYTEDKPSLDAWAQYVTPILLAGGGFIITTATDEKSAVKGLGYGLQAAGAIEGVKLLPFAGEFLKGILGETEIPAASAFLTESAEREKIMSGFGSSALPVGNANLTEVPPMETRLPDLEGSGEDTREDLGYNGSFYDDVDPLHGVI